MIKQVLLASVPCIHLEFAAKIPSLMQRVAFGRCGDGFQRTARSKIGHRGTFPSNVPPFFFLKSSKGRGVQLGFNFPIGLPVFIYAKIFVWRDRM